MPTVPKNGAELVRMLRESGTGQDKLDLMRAELARVKKTYDRIATCDEVIDALEHALALKHYSEEELARGADPPPHATAAKARAFAASGEWTNPDSLPAAPAIEDTLMGFDAPPKPTAADAPGPGDKSVETQETRDRLGAKSTPSAEEGEGVAADASARAVAAPAGVPSGRKVEPPVGPHAGKQGVVPDEARVQEPHVGPKSPPPKK